MSGFEWSDDYNDILSEIASSDNVTVPWPHLRSILRYKLEQNIASFLADAPALQSAPAPPHTNGGLQPSGGLRLAPFAARRPSAPPAFPSAADAAAAQSMLLAQLDAFDGAPFTVQRLAELALRPRANAGAPGKYLRALERVLFVTSTRASFPPLPPGPSPGTAGPAFTAATLSGSVPSTPLFSPIPFLHKAAGGSSAPPSPLVLASTEVAGAAGGVDSVPALGLVDELDDPSPGHLSERPTALSATTTTGDVDGDGPMSLAARFVAAAEAVKMEEEGSGPPPAKKVKAEGEEGTEVAAEPVKEAGEENKS